MERLGDMLQQVIGGKGQPVVVYAALWPLERAFRLPAKALCERMVPMLMALCEGRTLLMPSFTNGFKDGVCDLDAEPSQTGALSETFRQTAGVRRTVSAFFSFAVHGPDSAALVGLRPDYAWGDDSVYAWLYEQNARIVTIGVHPTHCSFTHYAEWLMRERLPYRHLKAFEGTVVHEGRPSLLRETLLVRNRDPEPVNDFTWLTEDYKAHGMVTAAAEGVTCSGMNARAKIDLVVQKLEGNPLALLKNPADFEGVRKHG